jgi:parallel beta-helix repeat protein
LSDNIGPCSGNGLVIGADGIVLDCAGYTISSTGTGTNVGILINGIARVTIRNCQVSGFEYGFYLSGSSNNTLTGNAASNNTQDGFRLYTSSNNTLSGNTANHNILNGFLLNSTSDNNTLVSNIANSNANDGFYLDSSSNINTLDGNTANRNTQYGYYDSSTGSGTLGTANFYTGDICMSNGIGGSSPSGLGSPQY